jgi:hypothetical protein
MDKIKKEIDKIKIDKSELNEIIITIGKNLDKNVFDMRLDIEYMNLIPLITSIFEVNYNIEKITKFCYLDKTLISSRNLTDNYIINKYNYNMFVDNKISITRNNLIYHKNYLLDKNYIKPYIMIKFLNNEKYDYFQNSKNYNHYSNYLRYVWSLDNIKMKIVLNIYNNYLIFELIIDIFEEVMITPNRKLLLFNYLDKFDNILKIIK